MPGGFESGPGASDILGASDVRAKHEERAEAPDAAHDTVRASSSSATSAPMAASAPAVVDLVSDEESLVGDRNNENGDESDEKEQHRAHVNDCDGPLEGTASDQTAQRGLNSPQPSNRAKSQPDVVVDLDLTNSPRRLSKGTHAKAKGKRQQHASAQWGALLTGSAKKKPTGIKDDSLLTAVAPVDTWGMVVDAKWRADFQSLTPMERNIQQTLKYMTLETGGPYTPAFALADGISEQAFRPPGSGSYAFDRLRSARSQHIAAPTWQLCAPNLHVAILAYLDMTARSLQGHLDPSVDELYQGLAAMVQHETHRAESLGFRILAALFYSRTRWVSEDQLVERWRLAPLDEESNLADTVRELCRAGHVRSTPSNLADCLDMLQSCTRGLLLQLAPLQRCGLSSATKGQVMAFIAEKGINFARKLCSSISSRLVRLSDGTRGHLRRCMVHLFAHTGYSSEETRYLLRHVSLADLSFAGSPPSAVAFGNLAANLPSKQEQEQKQVGDAEATSRCLQRIQQREDYFKAVDFSGKLSLYAAQGDAGRAYRVLHEASSRLMRMLDGAETFQLRELHALARVCLTGCQLLERERRYADTEHYLRMIIQSTGHHKELVMVHCEALLRLVQDLIHRNAKTAALKLVEEALRQDAWVLGCALHPANESPNRLGGTGAALMGRCVRLSVPPRRWRLAIQDAARLNAPRLVHISAERANQAIGRQSSGGSAGGGSQTGKPIKASWETASTVEGVVLEHFQRHGGWSGIHCENGFGITVYTLIFWDIIFDLNAPHAERHSAFVEMPRAAADGTWLRYPATRQAVEARLAAIADEGMGRGLIHERVEAAWDRATATHARGVNLDRLSLQDTLFVLTGISLRAIAMICSLFAENYKAWNGGLPDLMLWRTQTNVVVIAKDEVEEISASSDREPQQQQQRQEQQQEVAETCFIEVKGPGDSLSDRQRAWIDKLTQAGADVSVCHVKAVAVSSAPT